MSFGISQSGIRWPLVVGFATLALQSGLAQEAERPDNSRFVIDKDRVIFGRIEDGKPVASEAVNAYEFNAYNYVVSFAHQFTAADLESAARRDVTFKDLYLPVRKDFKLDLIYFEGRLRRLRSIGPNKPLKEAGVEHLYEAWVFPKHEANPICVLFTELPPGLEPPKNVVKDDIDRWVSVAGYSFKLLSYESAEKDTKDPLRGRVRQAPLLMAKSPTLIGQPADVVGDAWHNTFLPAVMTGIGVLSFAVLGLAYWYRKGDAYLKQTLDNRREHNPFGQGAN